jgi:hypothetical protein
LSLPRFAGLKQLEFSDAGAANIADHAVQKNDLRARISSMAIPMTVNGLVFVVHNDRAEVFL